MPKRNIKLEYDIKVIAKKLELRKNNILIKEFFDTNYLDFRFTRDIVECVEDGIIKYKTISLRYHKKDALTAKLSLIDYSEENMKLITKFCMLHDIWRNYNLKEGKEYAD